MILLVVLFVLLAMLVGSALAYVTGAGIVLLYYALDLGKYLAMAPQLVFSQLDVFALMAMPLFILVGEIMNRGNVTRVLVDFAMSLIGWAKGGLGHVNILTALFFSGISGSAMADAAALSNTLVPEMVKRGYSPTYAGALTAASSIIGPIIPPSIILIFYGAVMNVDVAALFAAGIGPGLLLTAALLAANSVFAHKFNHPGGSGQPRMARLPALINAGPALMLPLVIVLGIVFGVMTPTEAAAVAVFAAIGVCVYYRTFSRAMMADCIKRTVVLSGSIFLMFAAASLVIYIAALTNLPTTLADSLRQLDVSGTQFLLLIMVFFLLFGMALDTLLGLVLVCPVLVPVAISQGADPVHVGIIVCLTLAIGLISPPLGGSVMVVSAISRTNYWRLFNWVMPFLAVEILVLVLVVLFPEISLFLPRQLGLM